MKLGFQEQNNGNGKLVLTSDNLKFACQELGIPDDAHTLRRAARAFDLYYSNKVEHVSDHTFRVASQNGRQEQPYQVLIKPTKYLPAGGYAYCTCQDWANYSGDQDLPDVNFWCKHSIAALVWLHNNNGNGRKRIANECGTEQAKAIQDKLNGQYAEQLATVKKFQLEAEFNWQKAQAKCVELVGEANVSIIIHDLTQAGKLRQDNPSHYDRTEWLLIYDACKRDAQVERDPKSLNRWSYNSVVFLEQCQEAIAKVRAEKQVEANDLPLQNSNGKRKVQMDKKLNVWILEADGTKTKTSCREICEQFESKQNPSIVTRLRAGIDSGADISTVELN